VSGHYPRASGPSTHPCTQLPPDAPDAIDAAHEAQGMPAGDGIVGSSGRQNKMGPDRALPPPPGATGVGTGASDQPSEGRAAGSRRGLAARSRREATSEASSSVSVFMCE
jgi:hypothetical protein